MATAKKAATAATVKFAKNKPYRVRDRAGGLVGEGKYIGSEKAGWHTVNMAPKGSRTPDHRNVRASQLERIG